MINQQSYGLKIVTIGNSELGLPEENVVLFCVVRIWESFYIPHFLIYTLELSKLEEEVCLQIPSRVAELSPELQCVHSHRLL
jgi:hypothetical protein